MKDELEFFEIKTYSANRDFIQRTALAYRDSVYLKSRSIRLAGRATITAGQGIVVVLGLPRHGSTGWGIPMSYQLYPKGTGDEGYGEVNQEGLTLKLLRVNHDLPSCLMYPRHEVGGDFRFIMHENERSSFGNTL